MAKIFIRTANTYGPRPKGLVCPEKGKAQQQFKDECDINVILKRFGITGKLPTNVAMPLQGDFSEVMDYHTAQTVMAHANQGFMRMPAEVRARFYNDAGLFVDFISDPNNAEDARKMGVALPEGWGAPPLAGTPQNAPEVPPAPSGGATPPNTPPAGQA